MKNTGIVRKVDQLGRIVLPIELRRVIGGQEGDAVEILVDEQRQIIALCKYRAQQCLFCESTDQLSYFSGKFVCSSCLFDVKMNRKRILESAARLETEDQ